MKAHRHERTVTLCSHIVRHLVQALSRRPPSHLEGVRPCGTVYCNRPLQFTVDPKNVVAIVWGRG
jgi:hypothetical protein